MRVLYIGGYGRSGSTMLDTELSKHPEVRSGGEIFRAAEIFANHNAMCTCGLSLEECSVWSPVEMQYEEKAAAYGGLNEMQNSFHRFEGLLGWRSAKSGMYQESSCFQDWYDLNKLCFEQLAEHNPKAAWIVDSSKTARGATARALLLDKCGFADVAFLPVQRLVSGVLKSVKSGSNRNLELGVTNKGSTMFVVQSLIGWTIANAAATSTSSRVRKALEVANFESVLRNPKNELDRIFDALGISPIHQKRDEMQNCVRHAIGGNRSRFTRHSIESSPANESDILSAAAITLSRLLSKSGIL